MLLNVFATDNTHWALCWYFPELGLCMHMVLACRHPSHPNVSNFYPTTLPQRVAICDFKNSTPPRIQNMISPYQSHTKRTLWGSCHEHNFEQSSAGVFNFPTSIHLPQTITVNIGISTIRSTVSLWFEHSLLLASTATTAAAASTSHLYADDATLWVYSTRIHL